jgi:aryl-alcohol dehydrogenase-like predicted oxidoreductase
MSAMPLSLHDRRALGWTNLQVSSLAMGTMQFGWLVSDVESMKILDAYVEAGGNFIQTANMYGADQNLMSYERGKAHIGVTEDLLGRWMQSRGNRDQLVIGTKVRARVWDGPDGEGLGRRHVEQAVEDSLRRLGVDAIDLYTAHWPDPETPIEETIEVFEGLVDAGKVRYIGLSNFAAFGALDVTLDATTRSKVRIAAEQPRYSLVNRAEYEDHLQEVALREEIGITPYSSLAGGFLTGKYRRGEPVPDSVRAGYASKLMNDRGWALLDVLDAVAGDHDATVSAVALAWVLTQPGITSPIVGANSISQMTGWLPAAEIQLTTDEVDRLSAASWEASDMEFFDW